MTHVEMMAATVRDSQFGAVVRAMNEAKDRLDNFTGEKAGIRVDDALLIPSGLFSSGNLLLDAALLAVVAADSLLIEGLWQRGRLQLPSDADTLKCLELLAGGRLKYIPIGVYCDQDKYGDRLPEGEEIQGTIYWPLDSLELRNGPDNVYDERLLGTCESPLELVRQAFGLTF